MGLRAYKVAGSGRAIVPQIAPGGDSSACRGATRARGRPGPGFARVLLVTAVLVFFQAGAAAEGEQASASQSDSWTLAEAWQILEASPGDPAVREWAERRLELVERTYGPDTLEAAEILDLLVRALCWTSNEVCMDTTTQVLASRALRIKESRFGPHAVELVPILVSLGRVYRERGGEYRRRALAIAERHYPPSDPRLLPVLEQLLNYEQTYGSVPAVRDVIRKILPIAEKAHGRDSQRYAHWVHEDARWAYFDGDLSVATDRIEQALGLASAAAGNDSLLYAAALKTRGLVRAAEGEYNLARRDLEASLAIRENVVPPNLSEIGNSYHNLGILFLEILDLEAARSALERTIDLWTKARGPDDTELPLALNVLARVHTRLGDASTASQLFQRALRILEGHGGPSNLYYHWATGGLGELCLRTGRFDEARRLLEQTAALRERRFGPDHPAFAEALALLGELERDQGRTEAARERLERALAIQERALGPRHPVVAKTLISLAELEVSEGGRDKALQLALRAAETAREHFRLTVRGLPERQALAYATEAQSILERLLSIATSFPGHAVPHHVYDELVRSRAIVLDQMASRRRGLLAADDPEVARLAGRLDQACRRLAALVLRAAEGDLAPDYTARVAGLTDEKERLERELAARSREVAEAEQAARAGLEEVRSALPDGAALVSYVRYGQGGERYGVFVLRSRASPGFFDLGRAAALDVLVDGWRREVSERPVGGAALGQAAEKRYREAGAKLRQAIWDRLASALQDADRVFLVPDGSLGLVSFAALPLPDGSYLVEHGPAVHYLSAERDLLKPRRGPAEAKRLVAFGGPDFDAPPGGRQPGRLHGADRVAAIHRGPSVRCEEGNALRFPPLPMAAEEARNVASFWASHEREAMALYVTGPEATETAFRNEGPASDVLHIATHGFFLDPGCDVEGFRENPLLRSGLVFASANQRAAKAEDEGDDGILTAEEIASLDLSRVETVVASACRSGVGLIAKGEGILGLRRAFEIAGVRSLVTSLWGVNDAAAREWSRLFYARRLAGATTPDAVREASRRILASQRARRGHGHPYVWAAFVSSGEWR